MTIEELKAVKITSVAQGKALATAILVEQKAIHKQMQGLYNNEKWWELSNRHFYLRKARHRILHETGLLAIKLKQNSSSQELT